MDEWPDIIEANAYPLETAHDFDPLLEAIGDAKIVMLGEASHGTSEFYTTRAELTKRLIKEKGFTNIAVEGDWPSCREINRYIKGYDHEEKEAEEVLQAFNRWPTWMWANKEIAALMKWLKSYNHSQETTQQIGFYGIDVYSLWESMDQVIEYLEKEEPEGGNLELARQAFSCFEPFNRQPDRYAMSSAFSQPCIDEVAKLLASINQDQNRFTSEQENNLNLKVNALVAQNAEDYYRTMVQDNAASWNIRDDHMVEAINEVLHYYGDDSKIIIWEHNTHIGDASATEMTESGMTNVGEILRKQNKKEDVYAVGFGTHSGTVIAGDRWGAAWEKMNVPPAKKGSFEDALHQAGAVDKLLIFNERNRSLFREAIGHRAIGVVYHPEFESYGNYVSSRIADRYDAFVYLDKTTALSPLKQEN